MRSVVTQQAPKYAATNERDLVLLRLIAQGNRPAFEELYCDYHRRLARFLSRLTTRHDLIDEVINDTLWIVWQKAAEFRASSQPSTWIMGIAYRCTLKSLRQRGGETLEYVPQQSEDPPIEEQFATQELRDWILRGLRHLPVEQRVALELAYYQGHSLEEIAEIMDCPISTVKARMFHARVKLRNLLPAIGNKNEMRKS